LGLALGGFMAVGKTTVGRLLGRRLGLPFVDLDQLIEDTAGCSVASIFAREGEPGFRVREARAVRAVVNGPDRVVALGGGTLHQGDNAALLSARFPVVVLHLPWKTLEARLQGDTTRPLAPSARTLFEDRQAGYRRAGVVVNIDGLSVQQAADAVLEAAC